MAHLLKAILSLGLAVLFMASPAQAARETNSYDGNIYFLYGANGSIVPPASTLTKALEQKRTSVIVFYLDDTASSKAYAPTVSALQLLWSNSIDLIPIATDEIQGLDKNDPRDEGYYWNGMVPQTVVINGEGKVILDQNGQLSLEAINKAISKATGLNEPSVSITIKSFNEYNSEPSRNN